MPEYVYALHDFHPEHDDEVPFKTGERIEVVEKDDAYGDGWWQVCIIFSVFFLGYYLLFLLLGPKHLWQSRSIPSKLHNIHSPLG